MLGVLARLPWQNYRFGSCSLTTRLLRKTLFSPGRLRHSAASVKSVLRIWRLNAWGRWRSLPTLGGPDAEPQPERAHQKRHAGAESDHDDGDDGSLFVAPVNHVIQLQERQRPRLIGREQGDAGDV